MNGNMVKENKGPMWSRDPNGGYHITALLSKNVVDDSTWIRDPNGGYHIAALRSSTAGTTPPYTFSIGDVSMVDYNQPPSISLSRTDNDTSVNISFSFNIPKGETAYESAVAGGYTGTEEEWLASLSGKNGSGIVNIALDIKRS